MRRTAIALSLAAVLGTACGGEERPTAPATPRRTTETEPAVEAHDTPPAEPPARLTRFEGEVVRARGPVAPGDALEPGDPIAVRGEGRADVDLGAGGRVVLHSDTEIRIAEGGPAQIVLVRGVVHALVPPGPSGPRPPLRIATPAASVDLPGSGEVLIIAHASGATFVSALTGLTSVVTGEVDGRRRLRTIELPPGRGLLVASRLGEPIETPARLAEARATALAALAEAAPLETDRARPDLADAVARLDESLHWLEIETRRGLELTSQHRDAVRAGQTQDAMRLQRELVTHSQQLYALRQVATARWERITAGEAQLARLPGASPSELGSSRRDRVQSLLGL
jgi:hypothetical protein